jgi:hypothetical protein
MGRTSKIFTALSAGAYCLLAYPGIFSGLSNDGKQSPALFYFPAIACLASKGEDMSANLDDKVMNVKRRVTPLRNGQGLPPVAKAKGRPASRCFNEGRVRP